MKDQGLLKKFPSKRIHTEDGMAITDEVWRKAHDYHRELQQFHTLLYHGHGIIEGFNVTATNPVTSRVVISPGIAVDSNGRTIVSLEERVFDIRNEKSGKLFLLLRHSESVPIPNGKDDSNSDLLYVQDQFMIQVEESIPDGPYIELACINRQTKNSTIKDARLPHSPNVDEIDLRRRKMVADLQPQTGTGQKESVKSGSNPQLQQYVHKLTTDLNHLTAEQQRLSSELEKVKAFLEKRVQLEAGRGTSRVATSETITIGICYVDNRSHQRHKKGIEILRAELSKINPTRDVKIEDNISLRHPLTPYTLVYLVGQQRFELDNPQMTLLYNYLREGGTLFIEACRYNMGRGTPPAEESFKMLSNSLARKLKALKAGAPLLSESFLFAVPPVGFNDDDTSTVLEDQGIILSPCDYGCLWQGERRKSSSGWPSREEVVPATREELRSAIEFGSNIIEYALQRRPKGK